VFAGSYLALRYAFPHLAQWVVDAKTPLPMPASALFMYMLLVLTGILVYAFSSEELKREFLGPILALLGSSEGGPLLRGARWATFGVIPLLAAFVIYRGLAPASEPPVESRIQHPTIPKEYEKLQNPFRNPPDDHVRTFLREAKLTGLSLEEGRRRLVARSIREGRILYQKNCRPCHGTKADGEGPHARGFRLKPANFTDPGTIATLVEGYLFWRIKEGGIGLPVTASPWDSAMPRWKGDLTDEEIWKIILAEFDTAGVEPRRPEKLGE
ncbi:MAG: c-type cytochrome, partial [Nitrospinota bacterium]